MSTYCKFPSIPFLSDPFLHPLDEPPTGDHPFTENMPGNPPLASPSDESDVRHHHHHHHPDQSDKNSSDDCYGCKEKGDRYRSGSSAEDDHDGFTKLSTPTPENTASDSNQTTETNELNAAMQGQQMQNENCSSRLAFTQAESELGSHPLYGEWNHRFSDPIWRSRQEDHRGLFEMGVLGQEIERPRK